MNREVCSYCAELSVKIPDDAIIQDKIDVLAQGLCGTAVESIQLAQTVGAEIYATVGSEEKVQYLMGRSGLLRKHIFRSRDTGFLDGVLRETNGKDVDLAPNSLSGELLHAT